MRTDRRGFIGGILALAVAPRAIVPAAPVTVQAAGLLRTEGTLADPNDRDQKFAAEEYAAAFNRALSEYYRLYRVA